MPFGKIWVFTTIKIYDIIFIEKERDIMAKEMLLSITTSEIILCVFAGLILLAVATYLFMMPIGLYLVALFSKCYISSPRLISMKRRHLDAKLIVETYIASKRAGLELTITDYESHFQAGGDIEKLMKALLLAKQSHIALDIETAKAIEKTGEDLVRVLENAVVPCVLHFSNVIGMSQDNFELVVSGKITVKTNLKKYIGGVREETIIARVTNEIIEVINDSQYYNVMLENPSIISDVVKSKKLDNGSALDIVSIDITDIRIGENLNLRKLRESADKQKIEIGVETEKLKQRAVFDEQQEKLKVHEAKIELINQEKEFNAALYEAVKNKDFGALDYFKIKNLQADTEMRQLIAHPEDKDDDDISGLFEEDDN